MIFTKGQHVILFSNWDGKGTCNARRATVYSCGKKQMVLMSRDGSRCFGRNFRPSYDQATGANFATFIWPVDLTDEQIEYVALELAAKYVEQTRAHLTHCLTTSDNAGYLKAINADIAALHEPRVIGV